jgi:hypothetical protein
MASGLAFGQSQKDGGTKGGDDGCFERSCCDGKDKDACPKGCGLHRCCDGPDSCKRECATKELKKTCYKVECVTVCLPTRPCLGDPTCGCGKGKGCDSCSDKSDEDGSKACDRCGGKGGLFGGVGLFACCECRSRVKKRLYMKDVTTGKIPVSKCVVDKGGEDKGEKRIDLGPRVGEVPPAPVVDARFLFGKPVVEKTISHTR